MVLKGRGITLFAIQVPLRCYLIKKENKATKKRKKEKGNSTCGMQAKLAI